MGQDLLISEYQDLGASVLSNVFANLHTLKEAKNGLSLAGKFKNIPAIICGAGPSLDKQIPLLKELKNKALIFGGGSSLNVLSHHGVPFHFAASFDPDPPYNRFLDQSGFEVPFFYQGRVSQKLLSLVHAPLLWVPDNEIYPLESFLYEKLGVKSFSFDAGWTVGNFMTALASLLGCDPIIFVGMDYSGTYSSGVLAKDEASSAIIKKDFILASLWTSSLAKNTSATYINATEGGIGFEGIVSLPFKEAVSKHLTSSLDLEAKVHQEALEVPKFALPKEDIAKLLEDVKASIERALSLSEKMLHIASLYHPSSFEDKADFVLADFELQEEIIAQKFLIPLWEVWKTHLNDTSLQKILFFVKALRGLREIT